MASGSLSHIGLGNCSHKPHHAGWTDILNDPFTSIFESGKSDARRAQPRYEALPSSLPVLETRPSPGRGLGLYASSNIPAYTCILVDDALLSIARGEDLPDIWEKYSLLDAKQKACFDALTVSDERVASLKEPELVSKLVGRGYNADVAEAMAVTAMKFQSNAFKTGALEEGASANAWAYAIFPTIARINHSCTPNAHGHYRVASGQQVIFSLREIAAGEELEIAYLNLTLPRQARQRRALDWGFQCKCSACSRPGTVQMSSSGSALETKYEDQLAIVHDSSHATANLGQRVLRSKEDGREVLSQYEQAISIALNDSYPWLRTALPKLYEIDAESRHLLGDESGRLNASSSSREWGKKLEGKIDS